MIIELDFDGVFYNLNKKVLEKANKHFGTTIKEEDIVCYNYKNIDKRIREFIISQFSNSEIMVDSSTIKNESYDFFRWVNDNHGAVLRTLVRDEKVRKDRENLLKNIFREKGYDNIEVLVVEEKPIMDSDIVVEDNPEAILRKQDGYIIIFDQPYNRYIPETERIFRAYTIDDIKKIIQKIKD